MKVGDLVKVKDCCAYGNAYIQQITGWMGLVLRTSIDKKEYLILAQGKTWCVSPSDLELISESR